MRLRSATASDAAAFWGFLPHQSFRAIAAEIDGQVIGIGGYALDGPYVRAFMDIKPEARRHRVALLRAAKMTLAMARERGVSLIAVAQDDEPTADRFLTHLGFEHSHSSPDGEVYRWR